LGAETRKIESFAALLRTGRFKNLPALWSAPLGVDRVKLRF